MKLHLVNDEKIINRTIDAFEEVFPGENLFVVTNRTSSFKWVRKETNVLSRTEFFARKDEFSFSEVYIHLLNKRKMDVLNKLDLQGAVVYWIVWGMDLYNKLLVPKGFRMIDPTTSYYKRKIGRMCCGVRLTDGNSNGMPERQYASSSRKWIILLLIRQKTIISI